MIKNFKLQAHEITPLVIGYGGCIASDKITVEGEKVGFMYREHPDNEVDSGWRFFAGYEDEEYVNNPSNLAIYNVNTIANYDSEIIPFLDHPKGSAFERDPIGEFVKVDFEIPQG